jgi:multidrug transporter EmrE-like cation transporter
VANTLIDNEMKSDNQGLVHEVITIACILLNISSIMASLQRFVAGVFFAVMHGWGTVWVSDSFFNSPEFFVILTLMIFINFKMKFLRHFHSTGKSFGTQFGSGPQCTDMSSSGY